MVVREATLHSHDFPSLEAAIARFLGEGPRADIAAACERVLSGPGLVNVYRFLRDTGVAKESPQTAALMREGDPAAVVGELGMRRSDRLCEMALGIFGSVYGAEAGNLALKALALGGVVVAGGIAPRLMPLLRAGAFVSAFRDKGRLSSLMETIPVLVALNPKTALLGAARVALSLL